MNQTAQRTLCILSMLPLVFALSSLKRVLFAGSAYLTFSNLCDDPMISPNIAPDICSSFSHAVFLCLFAQHRQSYAPLGNLLTEPSSRSRGSVAAHEAAIQSSSASSASSRVSFPLDSLCQLLLLFGSLIFFHRYVPFASSPPMARCTFSSSCSFSGKSPVKRVKRYTGV